LKEKISNLENNTKDDELNLFKNKHLVDCLSEELIKELFKKAIINFKKEI